MHFAGLGSAANSHRSGCDSRHPRRANPPAEFRPWWKKSPDRVALRAHGMPCTATGWRRQVCSGRFGLPGQKVFHSPGTPITVTNRNPIRRYCSARCRVAHWHVRNKPKPPHAQQQSITLDALW
jgi:hypothetical protein